MMRHIIFCSVLLFSSPYLLFAQPLKVDVSAAAAILIDGETGRVLYEKNAHTPLFPASTTKVATALYALSKKPNDLDVLVTASQEAIGCVAPQMRRTKHPPHRLEYGGTHMGIKLGEQIPFRDLLYGLMLVSANDGANVIAEYVSGSVPAFMEELNAFLKENGIRETSFYNPHGLQTNEHKTTAHDMAKMAQLGMKLPTFREIVKTSRHTKAATNKQPETVFPQGNALINRLSPHYYPKAIGVKTGYTESAGKNLVSAAKDENRYLIAAVMGCADHHQRFKDAISLFEAAFNEKKVSRTIFAKGFELFTAKVKGANQPLQATLPADFTFDYFPSEEPNIKAVLHWHNLNLPIVKGQPVGEIRLIDLDLGKVLKTAAVCATEDLTETLLHQVLGVMHQIKALLSHKIAILFFVALFFSVAVWLFLRKPVKKQEELV